MGVSVLLKCCVIIINFGVSRTRDYIPSIFVRAWLVWYLSGTSCTVPFCICMIGAFSHF